jgi:hypothetical protein
MLRCSRLVSSTALNVPPAFTNGVLQLMKLHQTHKHAVKENETEIAKDLEEKFQDELHNFRPLFSQVFMLPSVREYNPKLLSTMRYFGLLDDPVTLQLERLVGKQQASRQPDTQLFKSGGREIQRKHWASVVNTTKEEEPFSLPSERPFPRNLEPPVQTKKTAVKLHDSDRGHWVLREEGIAISKEDRRRDPY